MRRLLALLITLLMLSPSASADIAGYLCRGGKAGGFTVKPIQQPRGGACIGFEVRDQKNRLVRRVDKAYWGSGRLLISTDGRRVNFIQDYYYGIVDKKGRFFQYGRRPAWAPKGIEGLVLFKDGRRLAGYQMQSLVVRSGMVSSSVSHLFWVRRSSPLKGPLPAIFELTTSSLRSHRFDTNNGKQLSGGDSREWRQCPNIVSGTLKQNPRGWQFQLSKQVKGTAVPKGSIQIDAGGAKLEPTSGWFCLKRRGKRWTVAAKL